MTEMKNFIQAILILSAVLTSSTKAEEVVYAQVGDTVTLKLRNHLHENYLYWHFGDENGPRLAWGNPLGGKEFTNTAHWKTKLSDDSSLIISDIKQENFGTFVCKFFPENKILTYRLLKINITVDQASPLVPGEHLTLTCIADTSPNVQSPAIHWLNPRGEKVETNQGKHKVRVTSQDHGQWTCVVTNNKKETQAKTSVTVVDLSPAPSNPQYTSKSSPLTVPCSFPAHISWEQIKAVGLQEVNWHFDPQPGSNRVSGYPQRLFFLSLDDPPTWKKDQDRALTPVLDLKKGLLSLTRKQGREDDKGDYLCSMKVRDGVFLNRTVHVKVLQITSSAGTKFISGQQVNLSCSVGEPLPSSLRLKWVPPEQSSLPSLTPDHHPAHLTIREVGAGDGGRWRCELWQGNACLTSAVITLKIEPKLSVWMLVIICSVTVIIVLLLMLVFIICRRRKRKTSRLRHRLCKCKNPKPKGFYRT
ncbi:CD4-1 molecule isoform X2 [Labrus mixtus]|uniref:CD4-1 molecule isoform X2 n=1 Tax=Labrus mixtus TaxID=508554 RepID=UPI0029C06F63|nr:CD4-1 molecule isoform X2 [Labrus mixtus]